MPQRTCQKCDNIATLELADNVWEWVMCTEHAAGSLANLTFGCRILYVYPANGVARADLPADALALCR